MTVVKKRRRPTAPPEEDDVFEIDYSKPKDGPWSPAQLYSRSDSSRRVMFLELMVWAIQHVESIRTRREWEDFKKEAGQDA